MGDLTRKVDDLISTVSGARALPLSASCVLNRVDVLAALEELRGVVSAEFASADEVIARRDEILAEARGQAEQILVAAGRERTRIVSDTDLVRESRDQSDAILAGARESAREMRREIDDYVDAKLATFEVVLQRTMGSVARGRSRLAGQTGYGQLGDVPGAPRPPAGDTASDRPAGAGHVLVEPSGVRMVPAQPREQREPDLAKRAPEPGKQAPEPAEPTPDPAPVLVEAARDPSDSGAAAGG
ncbi:MAG: hypothetical protein ACQSGP_04480 [Frankia sp.]